MKRETLFSSKSDEWNTPYHFFKEINDICNFEVDLCATKDNALCTKYYTKETDALLQDWNEFKSCWCNPPYSNITAFVEKAFNSKTFVVMLIPARTDTRWFHKYIYEKDNIKILFIKGRLKFSNAEFNAPFPSMLVFFNINKLTPHTTYSMFQGFIKQNNLNKIRVK